MRKAVVVLRWVARIWCLASLAFLLSFALGSRGTPTASEAVGLALFPGGTALGLVIGWRRERLGGAIAVSSTLAFYLWSGMLDGRLPQGPWFLWVATPGILFLTCASLQPPGDSSNPSCPGRTSKLGKARSSGAEELRSVGKAPRES